MREAPTLPETTTPDRLKRQEAPRLEVYVSSQCLNCDEAVRLAEEAAARYPSVVVRVVDLDLVGSPPPDPVVAVPTYLLNGRVVSLGNPYPEELFARLHEAVE
jgi:alkyl hydroperoxide reductase subunit AhpF